MILRVNLYFSITKKIAKKKILMKEKNEKVESKQKIILQ